MRYNTITDKCLQCGKDLSSLNDRKSKRGTRRDARYCSPKCRTAACRLRAKYPLLARMDALTQD